MVTAFRAISAMIQLRRGSGLVLDWNQSTGMILAGGDSRIIRPWDAHREYAKSVSENLFFLLPPNVMVFRRKS